MTTRPELGTVTEGQPVIVRTGGGHRIHSPYVYRPATIVKASRVWLTIKDDASQMTWRMRRDTQDEGGQSGNQPRFYSLEQRAHDERLADAMRYLRSQGITVERWVARHSDRDVAGPWHGREVELADLLRAHESTMEGDNATS